MTDWTRTHEQVVEQFRTGWERPSPHAWDAFFDESVRFVQPMLRDGTGPALWWEEANRLLSLLPDLRADVLGWAGAGEFLYIHIRFSATLAGRPLRWDAVDLLRLSTEGRLLHRESFFDSAPVAATLVRRPRGWWRWWRSGISPFAGRRRFLCSVRDTATPGGIR